MKKKIYINRAERRYFSGHSTESPSSLRNYTIAKMMQIIKSTSLVMLFLTSFFYFTDAIYVMADGGNCQTYDSSLPGTPVSFKPCKFDDLRHGTWKLIPVESGASLACIGDTGICGQIGADGKEYLAKKDATDPAQQWTGISGGRFTNGLTGPNMCVQAMFNEGDKDMVQDYIQMKQCSDNRNQKFATFSSSARLAEYFRDAFYQSHHSETSYYAPFPHPSIYTYLNIHPKPLLPYYFI